MTSYEYNQKMYTKLPTMSAKDLSTAAVNIIEPFLDKHDDKYYAFLCNDNHYYTVFAYKNDTKDQQMAAELISVAESLGNIKAIETSKNGQYLEFWIQEDEDLDLCGMYVFLNYDIGVIEV